MSTGVPYFYASPLDQSVQDATVHPVVSLTVTEAFLPATCPDTAAVEDCTAAAGGDRDSPVCARLVMSGTWVVVAADATEFSFAQDALLQRHPVMADWPTEQDWQIWRLDMDDLWCLDYDGGAYQIDVQAYLDYTWPQSVVEAAQ